MPYIKPIKTNFIEHSLLTMNTHVKQMLDKIEKSWKVCLEKAFTQSFFWPPPPWQLLPHLFCFNKTIATNNNKQQTNIRDPCIWPACASAIRDKESDGSCDRKWLQYLLNSKYFMFLRHGNLECFRNYFLHILIYHYIEKMENWLILQLTYMQCIC